MQSEVIADATEKLDLTLGEFLKVDPRSYHVFEFEGDRLLFDRATGTTSALNDVAFAVLQLITERRPLQDAMGRLAATCGEAEVAEIEAVFEDLKSRGFFRFTPVKPATDEELEPLWAHKPRRIQLLMAEGCNLGCRYCYQWRNGTNQKHTLMPWSIARSAVDYLVWRSGGRNDLQITFFGGEPLLNYPMIQRVVEYCRGLEKCTDRRFTFELITNGTLLTKDVVDYIVEHKFLLFISLDGWREMHDYNRPALDGSSSFDTIVQHALYANEQYTKHELPLIKVRANLTAKFHDGRRVQDFFESLGFKLTGIGAVEPLPHGDPSPSALTEDQMDKIHHESTEDLLEALNKLKSRQRLTAREAKRINQAKSLLEKNEHLGVTCGVCRNTTIVDNRGNMYPCHRYAEMKEYTIGNVLTGLDRAQVFDYYRRINGHATSDCHDCWIRDYCSGGCAWLLSDKEGEIHHPTKRECWRRRNNVERAIWLRKELQENLTYWLADEERVSLSEWNWGLKVEAGREFDDSCSAPDLGESDPAVMSPSNSMLPVPLVVIDQQSGCSSCSDPATGGCGCGSASGGNLVQLTAIRMATASQPGH